MTYHDSSTDDQNQSYYHLDLIKWRQAELNWSDRKLAGMSELSNTHISNTLEGKCKKFSTLHAIAQAMGLKWEYLFKLDLPKSQFRRAVEDGA